MQRLAAAYAERRDDDHLEVCLRRQIAIEPWREEAHQTLMRLLMLTGRRATALAQFEACKRALRTLLDIEPSHQTIVLVERIRDGSLVEQVRCSAQARPRINAPRAGQARSPANRRVPPFVGREPELAVLEAQLEAALEGRGRVGFVVGEAGSGKTALLTEFARRGMQVHGELVAAMGSCNAQTGLGDPHLPFREVLQMLTGDVEAKRASESITAEHARRLWALLPEALQALLDSGPGLVDLLVPGRALLARAQVLGPGNVATVAIARLERLLQQGLQLPGSVPPQISLFEQVTKVLQQLARRQPLLLILDDLQWADSGSIDLLFHLGRRLAGSRILVLGAYRPDDVALGRQGERHPLTAVANELSRDAGEETVDLDRSEGRAFVTALFDAEPNRLGESFREQFYRRTAGHALFSVELFRGLQDRGELCRDAEGFLVEGPAIAWERLPPRVEAVIAERIGRLPRALLSLLQVASVEGEEFTAEVLARVRGEPATEVVRNLSGELSKEHRLVAAQRLERKGAQSHSRYRFRHQAFQQYLYSRLDDVERVQLHTAVGQALETLHGGSRDDIAVQLARHFEVAGFALQAAHYHVVAARHATRLAASAEALSHLSHGRALLQALPVSVERVRLELDLQIAAVRPLLGAVLRKLQPAAI